MPEEVVENIQRLKLIGENKFKDFLEKRVNSQQEALTETIPQNNQSSQWFLSENNSKLEWWTIIDGAALVRKLKPISSATFFEYIECEFITNILTKFAFVDRIDLAFDQYRVDLIKNATPMLGVAEKEER